MLLAEFDDSDPLRVKLAAVASQARSRMKDSGAQKPMSVSAFIKMLHDNDINIERSDLFDMIKDAPLKNIIGKIKNNEVVFKGQSSSDDRSDTDKEDGERTVEKMAARATDIK